MCKEGIKNVIEEGKVVPASLSKKKYLRDAMGIKGIDFDIMKEFFVWFLYNVEFYFAILNFIFWIKS